MTTPERPPRDRKPHHFNPAALAHSVIALPLLEQIEQELAVTKRIEEEHPGLGEAHNAAIFLNRKFPGGLKAALAAVRELLPEALRKVGAKTQQSVDEPDPEISKAVALGQLDGAVIRQLLGMDAARESPAIERIWPTRFEVIIDINLDFKPLEGGNQKKGGETSEFKHPDPRRVAKALIKKYIELAKKAAHVTDADQGVEEIKTAVSSQYVFARLEGKVIQALVRIDQREAGKLLKKATAEMPEVVAQAVGREGEAISGAVRQRRKSRRRVSGRSIISGPTSS